MNKIDELKKYELIVLDEIDRICKKYNIKYYLAFGTALGAIRHKGFIPWDDDVDLLIPREDYNRMISLFQDTDRYRLFAFEKNPEYKYSVAKLCDMTTRKDEFGYNNGVELGVDIVGGCCGTTPRYIKYIKDKVHLDPNNRGSRTIDKVTKNAKKE